MVKITTTIKKRTSASTGAEPTPQKKKMVITPEDLKTQKDAQDLFTAFCFALDRENELGKREPTSMFASAADVAPGPAKFQESKSTK